MSDKEDLVIKFTEKLTDIVNSVDNICKDNQVHKVAGLIKVFVKNTPYDAMEKVGPEIINDPIKSYILKDVDDDSIMVIKKLICDSKELQEHVDVKAISNTLEAKWKSLSDKNKQRLMNKAKKLLQIYATYATM